MLVYYECVSGKIEWYCLDYWVKYLDMDIVVVKCDIEYFIVMCDDIFLFLDVLYESGCEVVLVINVYLGSLLLKVEYIQFDVYIDMLIFIYEFGVMKEFQDLW